LPCRCSGIGVWELGSAGGEEQHQGEEKGGKNSGHRAIISWLYVHRNQYVVNYLVRPGFFALLVLLLLSLAACIPGPPPKKAQCRPIPCEHTRFYSIDKAFTPEEKALIYKASKRWESGTEGRVCLVEVDQGSTKSIFIHRVEDVYALEEATGIDPESGTIGLYRFFQDDVWIVTSDFEPEYVLGIMVHELGHALKLPHTADASVPSVMHPSIDRYSTHEPFVYPHDYESICKVRGCKCQTP
jgi:hypothetical protein